MTDLSHPAPRFSASDAEGLAKDFFNVTGIATPLDGERDCNYRLKTGMDAGWILKIVNASEPRVESEFQTALLDHLAVHGAHLGVPHLRASVAGDYLPTVTSATGEQHAVRLVSWLAGTPLAEARRSFALMRNFGQALGELDRALQGFMHPGAVRELDWDLRHAARARSRLHCIKSPERRAIAERFITQFEQNVQPRLASLRAQVIHNDATTGTFWSMPNPPAT